MPFVEPNWFPEQRCSLPVAQETQLYINTVTVKEIRGKVLWATADSWNVGRLILLQNKGVLVWGFFNHVLWYQHPSEIFFCGSSGAPQGVCMWWWCENVWLCFAEVASSVKVQRNFEWICISAYSKCFDFSGTKQIFGYWVSSPLNKDICCCSRNERSKFLVKFSKLP